MPALFRITSSLVLVSALALGIAGSSGPSGASVAQSAPALASAAPVAMAAQGMSLTPEPRPIETGYPAYMPMNGLRKPAIKLFIKCDESRAAGREVYSGRDGASLYGRAEGGFEFVYEALDDAGQPCVYPFAPWQPQIVGSLQGTQYIFRSEIPGKRVTFRTSDEWATINMRLFDIGQQRVHFEMRDIELDFPGAVQPMGALHFEALGATPPGLFTAVVRRSRIMGGKNAIFVPNGQTMLYVEDSDIAGNVGNNSDQEHSTYINGTLVSHFRNSVWHGQKAWSNVASGHQIKDKAYLRIYEDVTVSNQPNNSTPSAMPLVDISAYGFTWAYNLKMHRIQPAQSPREGLVDLRTEMLYGNPQDMPWSILASPEWRMPASPLTALDKVYLSVFINTSVNSFRTEPYVFALRPQGYAFEPGGTKLVGTDQTTRAQQRMVSLAFNTEGNFKNVYNGEGWTYTDPDLPPEAEWVTNRDAFIKHALGLIGR